MKKLILACSLLFAWTGWAQSNYNYYTQYTAGSPHWHQNYNLGSTNDWSGTGAIWSTDSVGGSIISITSPPTGAALDAAMQITAYTTNGTLGTYVIYLGASNDAFVNGTIAQGSFYAVEITETVQSGTCIAGISVLKHQNGTSQIFGSGTFGCTTQVTYHAALTQNAHIVVYANNVSSNQFQALLDYSDPNYLVGTAGFGAFSSTSNGDVNSLRIYPIATTGPVPASTNLVYSSPGEVDVKGFGAGDPYGPGVRCYDWYRDGVYLQRVLEPELADKTAQPNTQYTYTLYVSDFHYHWTQGGTFTVTTPAVSQPDSRVIGVQPTGSYWGGMGEQIDMRSGNLNYSYPLVTAQGRGGSNLPIMLSYNSQNWRLDPSGNVWDLDNTRNAGFGWNVQIGSLAPYISDATGATDHYEYQDASGALYRLDQNNNGVWSSKQSLYVWFDSNTNVLHFRDGSFWQMGCVATAAERDAGTYYPTVIEDSNGNQISITYYWGVGSIWTNTSSRIMLISDARGASVYTFSYTGPYLTGISNSINSGESFTLAYSQPLTITSPFSSSANFGTVQELTSITNNATGLTTTFNYDEPSGELTRVTFPYGGYIRWEYGNRVYVQSTVRAVQNRYLFWDNTVGERQFAFNWTSDPSQAMTNVASVSDAHANAATVWTFSTAADFTQRLPLTHERQQLTPAVVLDEINYFWAQDPVGNPYISRIQDITDPGQSYAVTKQVDQTVDEYGSVTETKLYDYSNLAVPVKTYTNTYLGRNIYSAPYASRYILNRLATSRVTDGSNTRTLRLNTFDATALSDALGITQHDPNYGTAFIVRGNITSSMSLGVTHNFAYDITGTALHSDDGVASHSVDVVTGPTTNYTAPTQITIANSFATVIDWSAFLAPTSKAGPNGDISTVVYDSATARPVQSTSSYGAVTTTTYSVTAPQIVATTNGRWVKTYLDGLGHVAKVERGDSSGIKSMEEAVYDTVACSPVESALKVSLPHSSGAAPAWRTTFYDALGRTIRKVRPDGASTYTYSYAGNTITATGPAGKWKKFTVDAFGKLIQVVEPTPNASSEPDHVTLYSYDLLGKLIQARLDRTVAGSVVSQYRTWVYDSLTERLVSKTAPETGTTSYSYNYDGTVATITDAKNQRQVFTYDSLGRVTYIARGNVVNGSFVEDVSQHTAFAYDGTNGGFSQNSLGRVSTISYTGPHGMSINEYYSYHPAGAITAKDLNVSGLWGIAGAHLVANYGYDNEGRVTSVQYPASQWNSPNSVTAGPTYSYGYDSMGRLNTMTDQNSAVLVSGVSYGPADEMLALNTSTFSETRSYNANLELSELVSGPNVHMKYNHSATQDNGRILSQTDVVSGETITYQYDSLNRLVQANGSGDPSGSWSQGFSYDGFGNLIAKAASNAPGLSIAVDPLTNRLQTTAGYDSNGNLTQYGGATYVYDVTNRISQANPAGGVGVVYGYDSNNRRIYKANVSGGAYSAEELYFYGIDGKKYTTWNINPTPGVYLQATVTKQWFGGRLLSPEDRLSSKGKYFPYGEDRIGTTPANPPSDQEKFATYTRDGATGLDYADQRYFNNVLGRFMSPDPFRGSARFTRPQSWNRYAYAEGDPINGLDPTGLDYEFLWDTNSSAYFSAMFSSDFSATGGYSGGGGDDWSLFSSGALQAAAGATYSETGIDLLGGTQVTSTITFQSDSSFLDSAASAIGNWISSPQGQATTAVVLALGAVALAQPELLVPAADMATGALATASLAAAGAAGAVSSADSPWLNGEYSEETTTEDLFAWRAWGGDSPQVGGWVTPDMPTSSAEAISSLSLPPGNTATNLSQVTIPAGTTIRVGIAAPLFHGTSGLGRQIQIMKPSVGVVFGPARRLERQ